MTMPEVRTSVVGQPSQLVPGKTLVVPGSVEGSFLFHKVSGTQDVGEGSSMPPPPDLPVAAGHRQMLANWITGGARTDCEGAVDAGAGDAGNRELDGGPARDAASAVVPDGGPPSFDAGPPPMLADLLLELTFEESGQSLLDSSGQGRPAQLGPTLNSEAADPQRITDGVGGALRFDGADDVAAVEDFPPPANITLMAWVRVAPTGGGAPDYIILNKHNTEYDLRLTGAGTLSASVGGTSLGDSSFNFMVDANRGQWFHVAFTRDMTTGAAVLYRDGVMVASGTNTAAPQDMTNPLWIGRHSQFNFGTFLGDIDQVRVLGRALTPEEVAEVHRYERLVMEYRPPVDCSGERGLEVYRRRIEPLVVGGQPSTCNQCHLSGTALTAFVQDTPCQSMACLQAQGLVDFNNPINSSILRQITMASPDSDLITPAVIQAEYDGFLAWITWSAACQDQACGTISNACGTGTGTPPAPDAGVLTPVGRCSEQDLGLSFERLVYASRARCASCHDPSFPNPTQNGPPYIDGAGGFQGALRTMYNLIGRGAVDRDMPAQSLLLLKPLNVVPHGGGPKFANTDDPTYRSFLAWLELYADCYDDGTPPPLQAEPFVGILAPAPGATQGPNQPLIGQAVDAQDGELTGTSVRWTRGQPPVLIGTGVRIDAPNLPPGPQTITLTATDSDGNAASASVSITVQ